MNLPVQKSSWLCGDWSMTMFGKPLRLSASNKPKQRKLCLGINKSVVDAATPHEHVGLTRHFLLNPHCDFIAVLLTSINLKNIYFQILLKVLLPQHKSSYLILLNILQ
jgi:hypothetical protein